jgi:lysophospholipase L1-like esterase
MSSPAQQSPGAARIPRRDFILLPLISLATVLVVLGLAEVGSRIIWPAYTQGSCLAGDDRVGFKWKPRCDARVKIMESSPAVYHFNECGFRASTSCGPKPPGALRIASLGSSSMLGYWVATEQVLPELLASDLARGCGREVDSQNLSVPGATLYNMADRVGEVIALQPDLVLLGISSQDLLDTIPDEPVQAPPPARPRSFGARLKELLQEANLNSRFVAVVRHYLYLDRERYIQSMSRRGGLVSMQRPLSSLWEKRVEAADRTLGRLSKALRTADIPLVVIYLPELTELQVIKAAAEHPDLDPFSIESAVRQIALRDGVPFVPSLEKLAEAPDPTTYFFAGDGHLSAAGHRRLADLVLRSMSLIRPSSLACTQAVATTYGGGTGP